MVASASTAGPNGPWRRRVKFLIFSLVPAVVLFGGLELALRISGFRFSAWYLTHRLFEVSEDGRTWQTRPMFTEIEPYGFAFCHEQKFPVTKPENTLRVALLGGSNVRRLGDAVPLREMLRTRLSRPVEIVNCGFEGAGSERALLSAKEAIDLQADVLVVYAGHNEFISLTNPATQVDERGNPLTETSQPDIRILQLAVKAYFTLAKPPARKLKTMRRRFRREEKEPFYAALEQNLTAMAGLAQSRDVKILFELPAYNYTVPPNVGGEYRSLEELADLSSTELEQALRQDPENAMLLYMLGVHRHRAGHPEGPIPLFEQAFLLDESPHRADQRILDVIRRAGEAGNVPVVDIHRAVFLASQGDGSLFSDQCHLNETGKTVLFEQTAKAIIALYE